jgi:hypothetical protein
MNLNAAILVSHKEMAMFCILRKNRTTLFFVWLESQNRMKPPRPFWLERQKNVVTSSFLVRLLYNKNISLFLLNYQPKQFVPTYGLCFMKEIVLD